MKSHECLLRWHWLIFSTTAQIFPVNKIHGDNIGPIWGRQYPGGPHVGPMNLAIRELVNMLYARNRTLSVSKIWKEVSACVPWRHSWCFLLVDTSEKFKCSSEVIETRSTSIQSWADPVIVFPPCWWCPPQESSQPHPPQCDDEAPLARSD